MAEPQEYSVGSLFAGIGGLDLGFGRTGRFATKWAVEIEPTAQAVLMRHFRDARIHDDVSQVGEHNLERVDVIVGGFPCQDLSLAGRRGGLGAARSGLWWQFHRILSELTPSWVLIENVPGLLSSNGGRDMGAVLGSLGDLGYGWAYRVLDAQYFGVAQRRRRVFIVGCLGDGGSAAQVLLEPHSSERHLAPRRRKRQEVAGTLGGGSGERGWAPDTDRMTFVPDTSGALTARHGKGPDSDVTPGQAVAVRMREGKPGGGKGPLVSQDASLTLGTSQDQVVFAPEFAAEGDEDDLPLAYGMYDTFGKNDDEQADMAPPVKAVGGRSAVAFANRGREGGAQFEESGEVTSALRGSDGGSSRDFVAVEEDEAEVAHTLTSEHDASEDGTGRGVPLVPEESFVFDTAQITSKINRSRVEPGLPASTLAANSQMHAAVPMPEQESSEDGAVPQAVSENQRGETRITDYARSVTTNGGKPGQGYPAALTHFGVRRLMPVECERLQGFPDGYTAHDIDGRTISDSVRYRMLGNAVCVNVAEWIANRLALVADAQQE